MKLSHLLLNSALALLVGAGLIFGCRTVRAGTFVCNPNCVSKAASGAVILAHLPQIVSLAKHSKSTKAKRTK